MGQGREKDTRLTRAPTEQNSNERVAISNSISKSNLAEGVVNQQQIGVIEVEGSGSKQQGGEAAEEGSGSKSNGEESLRFREQAKSFWNQKRESNRMAQAGTILSFHPELLGAEEISIDGDLWNEAAEEWKLSLVGVVFGARPFLHKLKAFVRTRWGRENVVSVAQMGKGVFLFSFSRKEDLDLILEKGPWTLDNRPLVLQPWSPEENYGMEEIQSLPLWVRFPGLPNHLRREDILSRIASTLGKPIRTDGFTAGKEKLDFARVLVEIHASRALRPTVTVKGPNGTNFILRVEYEWTPPRCANCL